MERTCGPHHSENTDQDGSRCTFVKMAHFWKCTMHNVFRGIRTHGSYHYFPELLMFQAKHTGAPHKATPAEEGTTVQLLRLTVWK